MCVCMYTYIHTYIYTFCFIHFVSFTLQKIKFTKINTVLQWFYEYITINTMFVRDMYHYNILMVIILLSSIVHCDIKMI